MNKLIAFIGLLIMAPALGVAGGVILSFWSAGNELQPAWGRLSGCVVVLVILLNVRNIFTEPATRTTRKHLERMLMAIFSVIIFPMTAGFCLFMLEDFPLNSGAGSSLQGLDVANERIKAFMLTMFAYLPFVINCWYIFLEGIEPVWRKYKPVSKVNDSER